MTKVLLRVVFFVWSVALKKILTMDNLWKRHVIVGDWCVICKSNEEFVDHLLHCEVACAIWNVVFKRFRLSWVMPRLVVDLFACWWTADIIQSVVVSRMVPLCLLWCLWREKNDGCFEDCDGTLEELKSLFFNMYLWIATYISPLVISYYDFLVLFGPTYSCILLVYMRAYYTFNDNLIDYK
jgi:hypothetical protein